MRKISCVAVLLLSGCMPNPYATNPYNPLLKQIGLVSKDTTVTLNGDVCVGGFDLPDQQHDQECNALQARRSQKIAQESAAKQRQYAQQQADEKAREEQDVLDKQHPKPVPREKKCTSEGGVFYQAAVYRDSNMSPQQSLHLMERANYPGIDESFLKQAINLVYFDPAYVNARGPWFMQQMYRECMHPDGYKPLS